MDPAGCRSGMTADHLRELVAIPGLALRLVAVEARLSAHPQFLADVDRHDDPPFVHRRTTDPEAPTLLVMPRLAAHVRSATRGWPTGWPTGTSSSELPGFGFSPPYPDGPITEVRLARTMHPSLCDRDARLPPVPSPTARTSRRTSTILIAGAHPRGRSRASSPTHAPSGLARSGRRTTTRRRRRSSPRWTQARAGRRLRPHPGDPARHARRRPQRLTDRTPLPGSPRSSSSGATCRSPATRAYPHGGDDLLGPAQIDRHLPSRPYYEGARSARLDAAGDRAEPLSTSSGTSTTTRIGRRGFYQDLRVFERLDEGGHFTIAEVPDAMAQRFRSFAAEVRAK